MTGFKRPKSIHPDDLEDRRVYVIRSRNLAVGVWDEGVRGFIGIREKFDSLYLFTEYEWGTSEYTGTAFATEATEWVVPADIPLQEHLRGEDGQFLKDERGYIIHNTALFDLLKPLDDAEREKRAAEWETRFPRSVGPTGGAE